MGTATYMPEGVERMDGNRYSLAGWLSLVAAVLFPVSFVLGILEAAVVDKAFGFDGPILGPSDGISVLFTVLAIYALVVFRRFLHDRHQYYGIDGLITLSIAWSVLFQLTSLGIGALAMLAWPNDEGVFLVVTLGTLGLFMLAAGVIDLLIGIRLLQAKQQFSELIRVFAVLTLLSGIFEVSILLSPLALLLIPVHFVLLGLILLREREEAEFV